MDELEPDTSRSLGVELTPDAEKAVEENNVRRRYPIEEDEAYGESTERMETEIDSNALYAIQTKGRTEAVDQDRIEDVYGETTQTAT